MVRDIVGEARLDPQPQGLEEFPAASNMVMNLIRANKKEHNGLVNVDATYREGIYQPWGNGGQPHEPRRICQRRRVWPGQNVSHDADPHRQRILGQLRDDGCGETNSGSQRRQCQPGANAGMANISTSAFLPHVMPK